MNYDSSVDQEYLEEFTKLFEEDYPHHDLKSQQIFDKALELLRIVKLVDKPIPNDKKEEYLAILKLVEGNSK